MDGDLCWSTDLFPRVKIDTLDLFARGVEGRIKYDLRLNVLLYPCDSLAWFLSYMVGKSSESHIFL